MIISKPNVECTLLRRNHFAKLQWTERKKKYCCLYISNALARTNNQITSDRTIRRYGDDGRLLKHGGLVGENNYTSRRFWIGKKKQGVKIFMFHY